MTTPNAPNRPPNTAPASPPNGTQQAALDETDPTDLDASPAAPADSQDGPDLTTGDEDFDAYATALASGDTPILGHLVLYSVYDGEITRTHLERWFAELGLDTDFLPPPLREVDAFERVTGPDGMRLTYPLDDPGAATTAGRGGTGGPRRRRRSDGTGQTATLMVRPVRRDGGKIVRHVVREVRDEENTQLSYDVRIGVCTFRRDNTAGSNEGAGTLQVEVDQAAVDRLPTDERAAVTTMLQAIRDSYQHRCTYLASDKLRGVIRRYVEHLNAIRVRPTGGVYFVHRQHADTLAALRDLAGRFGAGSHLVRVPLPDQAEMRQMVIAAFTTKARDDLDRLARDIAAAQRDGQASTEIQRLYHRFAELEQATAEHATLLSTSLDDTSASLQLVKLQLGSLLTSATGDEDDDQ